jgi:aminopeptidase YwaD
MANIESPIQTPASAPTSVPGPTETPLAAQDISLSDVDALSAYAMSFLEELTAEFSPRQSGTEQELAAAEFLASEFESLGFEASLEPFTVEQIQSNVELESSVVEVPSKLRTLPLTKSIEASATGSVVSVGMAFSEDIPAEGLTGKIALIERGTIPFEEKVERVAEAGALGAVIFNNSGGQFRGVFQNQSKIPAMSISREDGLAIRDLLEQGEVSATVTVETRVFLSQNVVAEKPGISGSDKVVVLGGHYDTVEDVPGANDTGSGTATVVTVAAAIADESYPFDIRFVLFGSEELGLHGSTNHLRALTPEQRGDVIAMFNFDALGTGATIGALGDRDLVDKAVEIGEAMGVQVRRRFGLQNATSDHAPFLEAGVPSVFFLADDISRIHTPEDKLRFVQPELMGGSAVVGIALLDKLLEE